MTIQQQQLEYYKNLIVQYLQTSSDAPWKVRQFDQLEAIQRMLIATGVMTEQQDEEIINQARNEAKTV